MAISLENLINLPLLTYYDENIKRWILSNATNNIIFTAKNDLPAKGEQNVLYVTEESIFTWDGTKYTIISSANSSTSGSSAIWGTF